MSEITPALTAEEWAENKYVRNGKTLHLTHGGTPLWFTATDDLMLAWDEDLAPLVALANAALPDDHQRKITRADLKALGELIESVRNEYGIRIRDGRASDEDFPIQAKEINDGLILAEKLAALLPPETP